MFFGVIILRGGYFYAIIGVCGGIKEWEQLSRQSTGGISVNGRKPADMESGHIGKLPQNGYQEADVVENAENWLKSDSLYARLKKYGKTDAYPFHMPGHKRREMEFENPFAFDITEIDGFDDLHHPAGILKEAMEGAAALYGSDATFFLVNGSTCGILAAISAAVHPGGRILIGRNCHKSVYQAALVNQLETEYLYPDILEDFCCAGGITAEQVEVALRQDRAGKIKCVVITSPTYEGLVSDVGKIAKAVHRHDALLIVDEAHGAHFPFHPFFPRPALELGADAVIQSLHKTLPSLTQTALLHVKGDRISRNRVETYLRVYQSSSPSYVLLASIDQCIRFLAGSRGKEAMENYVKHLKEVRRELSGLKHIKLLGETLAGSHGIYALDQGKLVLSVNGTGMPGKAFYQRLREKYHLQPEMYTDRTVTLITSVNDSRQGFDRLLEAAGEIDRESGKKIEQEPKRKPGRKLKWETDQKTDYRLLEECIKMENVPAENIKIKQVEKEETEERRREKKNKLTISQAFAASREMIPLEESPGRIAAGMICPYPPGIPLLVPGEEIALLHGAQIRAWLEQGIEIYGLRITENNILVPVIA